MTLDVFKSSTLDDVEVHFGAHMFDVQPSATKTTSGRRRDRTAGARLRMRRDASISPATTPSEPVVATSQASTLAQADVESMMAYTVEGDADRLWQWIADRGHLAAVNEIARAMRLHFGVRPRARLLDVTELEAEAVLLVLVAVVENTPADAVDALFEFTGTDSWTHQAQQTGGDLLVDVECA